MPMSMPMSPGSKDMVEYCTQTRIIMVEMKDVKVIYHFSVQPSSYYHLKGTTIQEHYGVDVSVVRSMNLF